MEVVQENISGAKLDQIGRVFLFKSCHKVFRLMRFESFTADLLDLTTEAAMLGDPEAKLQARLPSLNFFGTQ